MTRNGGGRKLWKAEASLTILRVCNQLHRKPIYIKYNHLVLVLLSSLAITGYLPSPVPYFICGNSPPLPAVNYVPCIFSLNSSKELNK